MLQLTAIVIWGFLIVAGFASEKPNIVIILGDDIGWNDFGFHGSNQIPTPNIDALGYNGIILNKYYTQHICSPSRAALLTGNYPIRSAMQGIPLSAGENRSLPLDMPLLPERLKELGYATSLVGKWHLGYAYKHVSPTGRGFDSHFGYWNGYCGYFDYFLKQEMKPPQAPLDGFDLHFNFEPQWGLQGRYATELFTEKALEVIEEHNTTKPLFLFLSHLAAHTGKDGVELGVPDLNQTNAKYGYISEPERRKYADIVNIMDASVGSVMKKLSDKNMLENSIILFFSDNGAQSEGMYQNYGSNWPFRGLKLTLYEGGLRGSAAIWSPLFQKRGYINEELFHITDWLPTFYAAAGGDVNKLGKLDGINQWPTLLNNTKTNRSEILLNINEVDHHSALLAQNGRYKLLNGSFENGIYDGYYGDSGRNVGTPPYDINGILTSETNNAIQKLQNCTQLKPENINAIRSALEIGDCRPKIASTVLDCSNFCLFDLQNDPCETTNIINNEPELAVQLKHDLNQYSKGLVPQGNRQVDLNADPKLHNNTWTNWLDLDKTVISV